MRQLSAPCAHIVALTLLSGACRARPDTPPSAAILQSSDSTPTAAAVVTPDPLASQVSQSPAESVPTPGLLIVAVSSDPRPGVTFAPVMFLPTGGSASAYPPGLDTGIAAFQRGYASPSREYLVLEGGQTVGTLRPTGAQEAGCSGFNGEGGLTPPRPPGWRGLAVSGIPWPSRWHRRELSPVDSSGLARLAKPLLLSLEASAAGSDSAIVVRGFAYEDSTNGETLVAAAMQRDEPRTAGYTERLSVFLVARATPTGLVPTYSWAHTAHEEGRQERGFLDAADLDGDGKLEFVTSISYYESLEYRIVQENGGEWPPGAGSGC